MFAEESYAKRPFYFMCPTQTRVERGQMKVSEDVEIVGLHPRKMSPSSASRSKALFFVH